MSLIKTELFGNYCIHHNEDYTLEANIDYNKNNRFYMPALTFLNCKDPNYPDRDMSWDNDEYLLLLHSALVKYRDFIKYTEEEIEVLKDLSETINDNRNDFPIILEMLQKGIDLGMFDEILNKQK